MQGQRRQPLVRAEHGQDALGDEGHDVDHLELVAQQVPEALGARRGVADDRQAPAAGGRAHHRQDLTRIASTPPTTPLDDQGVPQHSESIPSGTSSERPAAADSSSNATWTPGLVRDFEKRQR